jgi:hypothetical protein
MGYNAVPMHFLRSLFDLLPDVAGILLAALSLSLIFLPKELKVLEERKWRWLRWGLAVIFAAVGIGGLVSNAIQKSEDKEARENLQGDVARLKDQVLAVQKKLEEKQRASVGPLLIALAVRGQELKPNEKVPFVVIYGVAGNTAKDLKSHLEIFSVKGSASPEQNKTAHSTFLARAVQKLDIRGEDRLPNTTNFITLELTLSKNEINELLSKNRTVYIMARAEWKNLDGFDDHWDLCKWMEPPKMKYLLQTELPFHDCTL